jgi:hypothetical protein
VIARTSQTDITACTWTSKKCCRWHCFEIIKGWIITKPFHKGLMWCGNKDTVVDPALDYFKTMPSTTVATVVLAFDEQHIENTYDGTGLW